jgi:hypothetical protein
MHRTRQTITALAALVITCVGATLVTAPLALPTLAPSTHLPPWLQEHAGAQRHVGASLSNYTAAVR